MIKFKQFLVPAVIILMGAGAAFATNVSRSSQSIETGYYINQFDECTPSPVKCSTSGTTVCTWEDGPNTHTLYRSGTACTEVMYRSDN